MSDVLVAGQVADLTAAVHALRATMEQSKPPQVTVKVPDAPAPSVTVKAADSVPPSVIVNVPEAPPPIVNVNVPEGPAPSVTVSPEINVPPVIARAYDVRITERDADGFIAAFSITPRSA